MGGNLVAIAGLLAFGVIVLRLLNGAANKSEPRRWLVATAFVCGPVVALAWFAADVLYFSPNDYLLPRDYAEPLLPILMVGIVGGTIGSVAIWLGDSLSAQRLSRRKMNCVHEQSNEPKSTMLRLALILYLLAPSVYGQETVFELGPENEIPFGKDLSFNKQGQLKLVDTPPEPAKLMPRAQLLFVQGTPASQVLSGYRHLPGILPGLLSLHCKDDFEWRLDAKADSALRNVLQQALQERNELLASFNQSEERDLFKSVVLKNRLFEVMRRRDKEIGELFDEIVSPEKAEYYFKSMGQGYEIGVLSSEYFSSVAGLSQSEVKEIRAHAEDFAWKVMQFEQKQIPTEKVSQSMRTLYSELTPKSFLTLKRMMGTASSRDTIETYMGRHGKDKFDTMHLVGEIEKQWNAKK